MIINEKEELEKLNAKKVEKWGDDWFLCPHCHRKSYGVIEVFSNALDWYFNLKNKEVDNQDLEWISETDGFYCTECYQKVDLPEEIKNLL
jgi:hypothetical protein